MKKLCLSLLLLCAFTLPSPVRVIIPAHAQEADTPPPADAAPKPDKKKGDDVSGGRFSGDPIYVHISPMVLPVINENGVEQLVTIVLDVQVKNFDAADAMHTNMPKVMDSLMRALYGGLDQGILRNGKIVNVGKIKTKAINAVGEVIGIDNITDVLVQGVGQRML